MSAILNSWKTVATIVCLFLTITFFSCHKEGTGGKSSVSGTVKHHAAPIPNCIVYIKYGATEFPGTDVSVYDASVTADAAAHYEFKELRQGDYFLYGVGFDPTGPYNVTGGIHVKLKRNQSTTTDVPVTE